MNFYNEIELYAARWLRNLVDAGHIAPGVVDDRDIRDVKANDIGDSVQNHFFAGLGGWSYALRLAGWSDDTPVWTGSCPCQPFSVAGKRGGFDDKRHLWPEWFRLIHECRPPVVFGEQVASGDGLAWFDTVSTDLERDGYAVGSSILCAAGVGAPHLRHRLYFVAFADSVTRPGDFVAHAAGVEHDRRRGARHGGAESPDCGELGDSDSNHLLRDSRNARGAETTVERTTGREAHRIDGDSASASSPVGGFWGDAEWIECLDGKSRAIEPGTFPLAHGVPSRVGRLRAYGNAIVPQVAASFIRSTMTVFDP